MELRSGKKQPFSGFTKAQVNAMEQALISFGSNCVRKDYCKDLSRKFSKTSTGKPAVKWTEIQSWFQKNQENCSKMASTDAVGEHVPDENILEVITKMRHAKANLSNVELEAKSSTDGAWYDVDEVLRKKVLGSGDIEVRVKFNGFEKKYNEWVKVKDAIRQRSIPLEDSEEHSDCKKLRAEDPVLCFQETQEQAKYFDAHIVKIQRRVHDARGCRCIIVIRYDHCDNEEEMHLTKICCQPRILAQLRDRRDCT